MANARLLRRRRDHADLPNLSQLVLQCRQAGGINAVIIGQQDEHRRLVNYGSRVADLIFIQTHDCAKTQTPHKRQSR